MYLTHIGLILTLVLTGCSNGEPADQEEDESKKAQSTTGNSSIENENTNLSFDEEGVLYSVTLDGKSSNLIDEINRHPGKISSIWVKNQINQNAAKLIEEISTLKRLKDDHRTIHIRLDSESQVNEKDCKKIISLIRPVSIYITLTGSYVQQNKHLETIIAQMHHGKKNLMSITIAGNVDPIKIVDLLGEIKVKSFCFVFRREPSKKPRHFSIQKLIEKIEPKSNAMSLTAMTTQRYGLNLDTVFPKISRDSVIHGFGPMKEMPDYPEIPRIRGIYCDLDDDELFSDVYVVFRDAK